MSEDTSPVIDMPEGSRGANYEDGNQAAQVQQSPHNIESTTTSRHTSHTTISMPTNEATPITSNSLTQQNDQERPDTPSSTISRDSGKPLIMEKALLVDISADKGWVASLVERLDPSNASKQFYLKMHKFYDRETQKLDTTGSPIEKDITKRMPKDIVRLKTALTMCTKVFDVPSGWKCTHKTGKQHKTSSVNQHQEDTEPINHFLAEAYLQLSEFMENNVMVSVHVRNVIRVWSLTHGSRLSSFQTSTLEAPLALSDGNKFIATFSGSAGSVNIYHTKTGLISNTLRTTLGNDLCSKHHLAHQMVCAQFCNSGKLLFLIQVRRLKRDNDSNNALITFEGWDIAAEKPIFQLKKEIRLNWRVKNSYVKPFVIETGDEYQPLYTAVYTTLADNDICEFRSLDLNVFKPRDVSGGEGIFTYNWIPLSTSLAQDEKRNTYGELINDLNDYNNAACFRLKENPNVVLRIGRHTVQLWHVSDLRSRKKLSSQDRLIYICALKSPLYHSNQPFDYNWYRWDYSMSWMEENTLSESRGSAEEDEDASWQEGQTSIESGSRINNLEVESQASSFVFNDIDDWYLHGITFHDNTLENMLSISICEFWDDETASSSIEIYLPLGDLTSESYNVCTEYHYVEGAINALKYIELMPEEQGKSDEEIAISLFSYVRKEAPTDEAYKTESRNENALTILIQVQDFPLYNLLLNRVLFHAQKLGAGCYSAVTDSLFYLQSRGDTGKPDFLRPKKHILIFGLDILQSTCRKLQFLHIEQSAQSIASEEIDEEMPSKTLHKNLKTEFTDLKPKSTNEQILKHGNSPKDLLLSYCGSLFRRFRLRLKFRSIRARIWYAKLKYDTGRDFLHAFFRDTAHPSQIAVCVVPYVYFCSYDVYEEDKENISDQWNRDDNTFYWNMLVFLRKRLKLRNDKRDTSNQPENHLYSIFLSSLQKRIEKMLQSRKFTYKKESVLMQLALNQHENDLFTQKDTILETLLYFKWKKKIKYRFFIVCFVHVVYYVSFSVGVLFADQVFDYTIGTTIAGNAKHILTIALMLVSCGILWYQEVRQFFKMGLNCWKYFFSFYNYVDLVALIFPIINLWQMLTNRLGLNELSAITTIVLWLHGVLRLRAIAFFGVTVETIIQLMKSVYKTLIIMLLVIFAFTNAFIVLLARKEDAYFQEQYSGSMSGSSTENTVNYNDDSSSNNFRNPVKAFSTLWFFIYGVWDPINDGDAGDDYMIMVLAILFSFLTVLLFFNLVIALMSSRAEEVKALGKSVWLSHFAEVIAEVEQLWCTKSERVSRENNPSFIYYLAKTTDIRRQADILEEDSKELVQKLQSRIEKRVRMKNQYS
ncbi:hypothetical protein MAM1_0457d10599 [Mucor ambiguus]|uniref:Uncharacterized protein n=1 Tax=Mucor ambiguus TaxID=91626 RepID=A0A0C9MJN5_9FUNG|nr:hypothetical protein MAM1_0457d10599 [Mucor ambiguus]